MKPGTLPIAPSVSNIDAMNGAEDTDAGLDLELGWPRDLNEKLTPSCAEDCAGRGDRVACLVACVRHKEEESTLEFSICVGDEHMHKTFQRDADEKLSKLASRLQLLARQAQEEPTLKAELPLSKKERKMAMERGSSKRQWQERRLSCDQEEDVTSATMVHFYLYNGREIQANEWKIGEAFRSITRLTIADVEYDVVRNQPEVHRLVTMDPVLVGIPLLPWPEMEFGTADQCQWTWYRIAPDYSEEKICEARAYVPQQFDLGCRFRIECDASLKHPHLAAKAHTETVTSVVVQGPDRSMFQARQRFGMVRCGDQNSQFAFRVMTYNILFDGYTIPTEGEKSHFSSCPDKAMQQMYRAQLVYQEIEEAQPDIVCLQEMGASIFQIFFEPMLTAIGYHTLYSGKTGTTQEGCAAMTRIEDFANVSECTIDIAHTIKTSPDSSIATILTEFPEVAKGVWQVPSVAQLLVLQSRKDRLKHVIVANTHLFYREDGDMVRLVQAIAIVRELENLQAKYGIKNTAVVLCGDLNTRPDVAAIDFLLNGHFDDTHEHWHEAYDFLWNRAHEASATLQDGLNMVHTKNCQVKHAKDCSHFQVDHALKLTSACGIPAFTVFSQDFIDTLDYVLISRDHLRVSKVFPMFTREQMSRERAIPSITFPSDHLALVCDLQWKNQDDLEHDEHDDMKTEANTTATSMP